MTGRYINVNGCATLPCGGVTPVLASFAAMWMETSVWMLVPAVAAPPRVSCRYHSDEARPEAGIEATPRGVRPPAVVRPQSSTAMPVTIESKVAVKVSTTLFTVEPEAPEREDSTGVGGLYWMVNGLAPLEVSGGVTAASVVG